MPGRAFVLAALVCVQGYVAVAQPYDGVYVIENFTSSCQRDLSGVDGGPALVEGDRLVMLDVWCTLENPVAVRDMEATLFDASCFISGFGDDQRHRVMLGAGRDGGLMVVFDGAAFTMAPCRE